MDTLAGTATRGIWDGAVDQGIEHGAERVVRAAAEQRDEPAAPAPSAVQRSTGAGERDAGGGMEDVGAEAAAHALLRMVADHPGQMGRLRAARLIGGYPVPHRDDEEAAALGRYAVQLDWPLREIVRLVDAMLSGNLIAQTVGPRPVLVLTRAGFQALAALDSAPVRQ